MHLLVTFQRSHALAKRVYSAINFTAKGEILHDNWSDDIGADRRGRRAVKELVSSVIRDAPQDFFDFADTGRALNCLNSFKGRVGRHGCHVIAPSFAQLANTNKVLARGRDGSNGN